MPTIFVFHPPSFHLYQMNANFNLLSIFLLPLTHDLILQLSIIRKSTIYKLELIDTCEDAQFLVLIRFWIPIAAQLAFCYF